MEYVFVSWKQTDRSMPTAIYSELDAKRMEIRKVEQFATGDYGFASRQASQPPTVLSSAPVPSLSELSKSSEFSARRGTAAEFEALWKKATRRI